MRQDVEAARHQQVRLAAEQTAEAYRLAAANKAKLDHQAAVAANKAALRAMHGEL